MHYDLIIFDWDGTLSDSAGAIVRSIRLACEKRSIVTPSEGAMRSIIGLGLDEAFVKLFDTLSDNDRIHLQDSFREAYLTMVDNIVLFDGVVSGIKMLHHQGFKLAVATGKSRRGLDNALRKANLTDYFSVTKTMDECFSKPHPQMINEILDQLMIEKEKALMVGDSSFDLEMASNASIDSVAVAYGSQEPAELQNYHTRQIIHNPHDLFDWLRIHG